jgi:hypothetical protein
MAVVSGWVTLAFIFVAGLVPLGYRLLEGRRAGPHSRPISLHVMVGVVVAATAFAHAMVAVTSLGTPQAIGGGNLGLALGGVAVFVLMAHIGIGLRLRDPKLRRRKELRGRHRLTALTIVAFAIAHTVIIWANK